MGGKLAGWLIGLLLALFIILVVWFAILATESRWKRKSKKCKIKKCDKKPCFNECPPPPLHVIESYTIVDCEGKTLAKLQVIRFDAITLHFHFSTDSESTLQDIYLEVQPTCEALQEFKSYSNFTYIHHSANTTTHNVTLIVPHEEQSGPIFFALFLRTSCGKGTLDCGQELPLCSSKNLVKYTTLQLCVPKTHVYQVISPTPLSLRSSPDTTDGSNIIATVPTLTLVHQLDTLPYIDVFLGSGIQFYYVSVTAQLQGYLPWKTSVIPTSTTYHLGITVEAALAQQKVDVLFDNNGTSCDNCLQVAVVPPISGLGISGDQCCEVAYNTCYTGEASEGLGLYCIFHDCGADCRNLANASCEGSCYT